MAIRRLDNNVVRRRSSRGSRWLELGLVVGLSVAVVVFAALWERGSETAEPESVGVVEMGATDRSSEVAAGTSVTTDPTSAADLQAGAAAAAESSDSAGGSLAVSAHDGSTTPNLLARPLPNSFERYQVRRGESLAGIAKEWGISLPELLLWNRHLDEDTTLIRGEWLWIPQWRVSTVAVEQGSLTEDGKSGRGGG